MTRSGNDSAGTGVANMEGQPDCKFEGRSRREAETHAAEAALEQLEAAASVTSR